MIEAVRRVGQDPPGAERRRGIWRNRGSPSTRREALADLVGRGALDEHPASVLSV